MLCGLCLQLAMLLFLNLDGQVFFIRHLTSFVDTNLQVYRFYVKKFSLKLRMAKKAATLVAI